MPFQFQWNKDKTVMIYKATGDWNWKDYHLVVRSSLFWLQKHEGLVDVLIDLTGSTRDKLPAGAKAHIRSFTKQQNKNLSGRAVVLGASPEDQAMLGLDEQRQMTTSEGVIRFVDTLDEAVEIFRSWRTEGE